MKIRTGFFALAVTIVAAAVSGAPLHFIEDDYKEALAQAKAKNVPIFVETWAPW